MTSCSAACRYPATRVFRSACLKNTCYVLHWHSLRQHTASLKSVCAPRHAHVLFQWPHNERLESSSRTKTTKLSRSLHKDRFTSRNAALIHTLAIVSLAQTPSCSQRKVNSLSMSMMNCTCCERHLFFLAHPRRLGLRIFSTL